MFPAFKPHEIAALPFSYFRKMRDYFDESRQTDADAVARMSEGSSPDMNVVEFEGSPVG